MGLPAMRRDSERTSGWAASSGRGDWGGGGPVGSNSGSGSWVEWVGLAAMRRYSERTSGWPASSVRRNWGWVEQRDSRMGWSAGLPIAASLRLMAPMSRPRLMPISVQFDKKWVLFQGNKV